MSAETEDMGTHEEQLKGYARYQHLRANVRKRRAAYKALIFVAIGVFLLALADMILLSSDALGVDRLLEYIVYALFAIVVVWMIFMLFSRSRAAEEAAELAALQNAFMQCPECKNIFQFSEVHLHDRKKATFSCPVCGTFSALPSPDAEATKARLPDDDLYEHAYECTNCNEAIRIAAFGEGNIHTVQFRTCPHCGEHGTVKRVPAPGELELYGPEGAGA